MTRTTATDANTKLPDKDNSLLTSYEGMERHPASQYLVSVSKEIMVMLCAERADGSDSVLHLYSAIATKMHDDNRTLDVKDQADTSKPSQCLRKVVLF